MLNLLTVLLFFVAVLTVVVVYFQDSEDGLVDNPSLGNAYGVKTVNKFLERLTGALFALLVLGALWINRLDINERRGSVLDTVPASTLSAPTIPAAPAVPVTPSVPVTK